MTSLMLAALGAAAIGALQAALPFHVYALPDAYELIDAKVETTANGPVAHLVYREMKTTLDVVEGSPSAVMMPRIPEPAVTATINGAGATYGTEYVNFRHYGAIAWRAGDVVVVITSQDEASVPLFVNAVLALR